MMINAVEMIATDRRFAGLARCMNVEHGNLRIEGQTSPGMMANIWRRSVGDRECGERATVIRASCRFYHLAHLGRVESRSTMFCRPARGWGSLSWRRRRRLRQRPRVVVPSAAQSPPVLPLACSSRMSFSFPRRSPGREIVDARLPRRSSRRVTRISPVIHHGADTHGCGVRRSGRDAALTMSVRYDARHAAIPGEPQAVPPALEIFVRDRLNFARASDMVPWPEERVRYFPTPRFSTVRGDIVRIASTAPFGPMRCRQSTRALLRSAR